MKNTTEAMTDLNHLSFYSQQAIQFSAYYAENYHKQHALPKNGLSTGMVGFLAAARLEWLMERTRHQLNGRFSSKEIGALLNCYQAEIFFPQMFDGMASAICDDQGIEVDAHENSPIALLVQKLLGLSPLERVTLADAVEQAWYRTGENDKTHIEVLAELGILLR